MFAIFNNMWSPWILDKQICKPKSRLTSAATLPNVSSPSCRSEMRLQWAQSKRKRRHVRLAASSLTLASSKERFRRITAICSTRWASMSLMPGFRGGWKRLCHRCSHDVPSAQRGGNNSLELQARRGWNQCLVSFTITSYKKLLDTLLLYKLSVCSLLCFYLFLKFIWKQNEKVHANLGSLLPRRIKTCNA